MFQKFVRIETGYCPFLAAELRAAFVDYAASAAVEEEEEEQTVNGSCTSNDVSANWSPRASITCRSDTFNVAIAQMLFAAA